MPENKTDSDHNNSLSAGTIADSYPSDKDVWIVGDKYYEKVNFVETDSSGNISKTIDSSLPGGAWYVKRFIDRALHEFHDEISTWTYDEPIVPPQTNAATHTLSLYPRRPQDSTAVYRISGTKDYSRVGNPKPEATSTSNLPKKLLVIEDMDLGYRTDAIKEWQPLLEGLLKRNRRSSDPHIVALLGGELPESSEWICDAKDKEYSIWSELFQRHSERTVVIVNADLLRFTGANISRRVSWERTAQDLVTELQNHPRLQELGRFAHLVVRFGVTAAVHCFRVGDDVHRIFYYDTKAHDGIFRDITVEGAIIGNNSVFTACMVRELLLARPPEKPTAKIGKAIKDAIPACQRLFRLGYPHVSEADKLEWYKTWPSVAIFDEGYRENTLSRADPTISGLVRHSEIPLSVDNWSILRQSAAGASILKLARRIVFRGVKDSLNLPENSSDAIAYSAHAPLARFGDVIAIDRDEIESFRGVYNLIKQYCFGSGDGSHKDDRPLCIAMFGPPGSGKSFIVKQILKELNFSKKWPRPTINMTQVSSLESLGDSLAAQLRATNRILKIKLPPPPADSQGSENVGGAEDEYNDIPSAHQALVTNEIPVVFFDEFDCDYNGKLGWLKTLLAPMEDGLLGPTKDGSFISLKRSILVFAGGTKRSYKDFACELPSLSDEEKLFFEGVKGPDFVSRLRGHVDVKGINRADAADTAFLLRRAVILRELLWEHRFVQGKRATVWGNDPILHKKLAQIDYSVIHALMKVGSYKHGSRSMRAVISMCIPLLNRIEKASLPAAKLLDMHVDSTEFRSLIDEYQPGDEVDNKPKAESYFLT